MLNTELSAMRKMRDIQHVVINGLGSVLSDVNGIRINTPLPHLPSDINEAIGFSIDKTLLNISPASTQTYYRIFRP